MTDRWFPAVFSFLQRHRWKVLILLAGVTALSIWSIRFISFDSSLAVMFPRSGEIPRALRFLQEARFSGKVVLSLERTDPDMDKDAFLLAVERFAGTLNSPLLRRVGINPQDPKMLDDLSFFLRHAPQILDPGEREEIERQLTPDSLGRILRRRYLQLLKPEGSFLASAIRRDPLGIQDRVAEKMRRMSASFGYDVSMEKGQLVSRDGRHAMIILETPVALTDVSGCHRVVESLEEWLKGLPRGLSADVICGHKHTVSNQKVIQSDIQLTATIESVVFLVVFLVLFRHPAAIWIFLIPEAAVVVSLNVCALFQGGRMSALVVGLGSVLAGIAVDYGNHVFIAIRHKADPAGALGHVLKPLTLGALITVMVFLAFLFSGIDGYRQIGGFAMLSILLALGYVIFILPLLVRYKPPKAGLAPRAAEAEEEHRSARPRDRAVVVVFGLCFAAALALAIRVPFDSEVMRMDGTEKGILNQERRFHEVWGGGDNQFAFLVASAADRGQAAEVNQEVCRELSEAVGPSNVLSLAMLWPSKTERERRGAQWIEFWKGGREENLRLSLAEQGKALGFAEDAFSPFFAQLYEGALAADDPRGNLIFDRISERFVQRTSAGFQYVSYLPDREAPVAAAAGIAARHSGTFVVSRKALTDTLSVTYQREVGRVFVIAFILIVLTTVAGLWDFRRCCLAFVPSAAGMVFLLALMALLGYAFTIANLIAGIMIVGLCMDFGVLMGHAYEHGEGEVRDVRMALHMSAVTMGVGAGVLLFAKHPALFSIGLTLSVGVLAGYVTAMVVVPSLHALLSRRPGP